MKMQKNLINKAVQTLLLRCCMLMVCIIPSLVIAQDPGGGPDVPIDGGLSLLLAAGTAYGIKKYRNYKATTSKEI